MKQWLNHWIGYVDETCFDINVLSIDSKTVITNGYNKAVDEQLSKYNIKMIPFNFRHKYLPLLHAFDMYHTHAIKASICVLNFAK